MPQAVFDHACNQVRAGIAKYQDLESSHLHLRPLTCSG